MNAVEASGCENGAIPLRILRSFQEVPMAHYEVIIVGAGPAGLSTALHLQQMAPELAERTLILEKARHPRTKLCGGGVTPDAERVLGRLGLDVTEVPTRRPGECAFSF
jgi:ribulose 1,5-bisphosphate synthetase/thiazole synthase